MRCAAYCTATAYDFNALWLYLKQSSQPVKYHSVIHVQKEEKNIFYFRYGCVICWQTEKEEELEILKELKSFHIDSLPLVENEKYEFRYGDVTKIIGGIIYLSDADALKKLAISHGIAQSVKLTTFENTIQETINESKKLPEELAAKGKISLSRRQISKRIGKLFIERSSVNLHSDILDTPEFFWEYEILEPFYMMTINNLDLRPRVEVLNKRLSIVHELFEMLGNTLNHQYSSILEWIIIILIAVEILTGIMKDFLILFFH